MPAYFEAGKGSLQRPEDHKKFSDNYDMIFRKKDCKEDLSYIKEEDIIQPEVQEVKNNQ